MRVPGELRKRCHLATQGPQPVHPDLAHAGLGPTLAVWEAVLLGRLDRDHHSIAADNRKKRLVSGLLECSLKIELIAVERERGPQRLPR